MPVGLLSACLALLVLVTLANPVLVDAWSAWGRIDWKSPSRPSDVEVYFSFVNRGGMKSFLDDSRRLGYAGEIKIVSFAPNYVCVSIGNSYIGALWATCRLASLAFAKRGILTSVVGVYRKP
jgi:hypothetical protein